MNLPKPPTAIAYSSIVSGLVASVKSEHIWTNGLRT